MRAETFPSGLDAGSALWPTTLLILPVVMVLSSVYLVRDTEACEFLKKLDAALIRSVVLKHLEKVEPAPSLEGFNPLLIRYADIIVHVLYRKMNKIRIKKMIKTGYFFEVLRHYRPE